MTDWNGNRANERYSYRRVRWAPNTAQHFAEGEDYGNVTGGTVELSAFTDTKASCSFQFEGGTPPDTTDLVRVYYAFEDDEGQSAECALGTFFVSYSEVSYERNGDALKASGSAQGSSVLSLLIDRKLGAPYTIAAGVDCVAEAQETVEGFGLLTNHPTSKGTTTASAHTFEPDDSWLTVVNWLLASANFQACYPDPLGTVMMVPYTSPESRSIGATFKDDGRSIMLPQVGMGNDWIETPNVVRAYYETDDECLAVAASLVSGSRSSLAGRGQREVTMVERVDEIAGDTQADRLENLKAYAVQRLIDQSAEIEKVTLTHAFIEGIQPNDAIAIEYSEMEWRGNITDMSLTLTPSTPCVTKIRKFISKSLTVSVTGGVLW